MEDLTKLLGSVTAEDHDPNVDVPSSHAPSVVPASTGESGGIGAPASPPTTTSNIGACHLLYITEEESKSRCMGMIGKAKFCIATECTIAKHDTSKFYPNPGLYIRMPKRMDQCFCRPSLPDDRFDAELASELL